MEYLVQKVFITLFVVSISSFASAEADKTATGTVKEATEDKKVELKGATTWVNQSGSIMTISVNSKGAVSGQYINRAAGTKCQGTPYKISGWALNNFISFSVRWDNAHENCNSITGWTGYATADSSGKINIKTKWNLVYQSASGSQIQPGEDTFQSVSKAMNVALVEKE